jgi:hypothetical protein
MGICFWASFLFFVARSRQRLNSSMSVATEYIKCGGGVWFITLHAEVTVDKMERSDTARRIKQNVG